MTEDMQILAEHTAALRAHAAAIEQQNAIMAEHVRALYEHTEQLKSFENFFKRAIRNPQTEITNVSWIMNDLKRIAGTFEDSTKKVARAADEIKESATRMSHNSRY